MLFAAVQWNDPDGWLWIMIYAYTGILVATAFHHYKTAPLCFFSAAACAAGFLVMIPADPQNWMPLEVGREAMGLGICALGMSLAGWSSRRQRPAVS